MNQLVIFGTAVMFLTRLPVGRYASGDSLVLVQAVRYFPLVGLIVALIMGSVLLLSSFVLPLSAAVVLTLVVGVMSTGAFHEDGLADLADSAGAFDVSRKLDIMRDSRVGTYGSLGLILCIALRFVLILELATLDIGLAVGALILAHSISRWSSAYLMATIDYARSEAANKVVAQGVDTRVLLQASVCLLLVIIITTVMISPLVYPWVYAALPVAWLATSAFGTYFKSTFNGITGDCLGAANVVVELVCLTLVLACT
ncbi:MAG: adenosylcobinamide-GDP ribazoletransferase [Granulosicoccus sp.]